MLGLFVVLFYIPSVNARFFEVIGKLYHLAGGKDDVWSAGYSLFRFWHKLG